MVRANKSRATSAQLVDQMIARETQEWIGYVKIANIEPQ
jgi:hypothetical protein